MSHIRFENVKVVFGDDSRSGEVVAVDEIRLTIEPGEIFVIMGLSGSGKSTLLRCINGLTKPTSGSVFVTNKGETLDVTDCAPSQLRQLRIQHVSMVFQRFALLPWRTVAQNVALGLELAGVPKSKRLDKVAEHLELVGLADCSDKLVQELSGGMQQRVGLARALVTDAEILLMDEPFSALDPLIRSRLQEELLELQGCLQKTIVFVSHDLDEAFRLGSRIAIMEAGRIVQYGEAHEIIQAPTNDYVRDFIAQMNPLKVLTARTIMLPIQNLPRAEAGYFEMDEEGKLLENCENEGRLIPLRMTFQEVIRNRSKSDSPLIVGEKGRVLGVIRDQEIFRALSHRAIRP